MVSKIGKIPLKIPPEINVTLEPAGIKVVGPKGELSVMLPPGITLDRQGDSLTVSAKSGADNFHGLARTLIANAFAGVTRGWTKNLEMVGTGYRATVDGQNLILSVGFSHAVTIIPSSGISFAVTDQTKIAVSGISRELVGQTAANIRSVRPPEPYKGKGIKYADERIRRKAGKAAKAVGATGGK